MTSTNTDDFAPEIRNAAWWSGDSRLAANGRAADAILVKQGKKEPPDLSEVEDLLSGERCSTATAGARGGLRDLGPVNH